MLSLALPGTSWAHRLPAGLKFAALALAMAALAFVARPVPLAAALAVAAALYASLGRGGLTAGGRALRPLIWIVGLIVLWQILVARDPAGALVLALRIAAMASLATFVTLTTPLSEIVALVERLSAPLARLGLSPRLPALAAAMALRLIPALGARIEALALAWRARARRRPGARLLAPLTLSLLDDSDHMADALRARGGLTPPRPIDEKGH